MAQALTSVLDRGVPVGSVAEIERELRRLRRRAGAATREGVAAGGRAAVLNAIVHATRRVHAERAARVIAELGVDHPSRAIVLFSEPADAAGRSAGVRLTCYEQTNAAQQICYEQIVVRASEATAHQLRSIVIPLLIADLPVFLWWTGTPALTSLEFRHLAELAHRVVVDSADFPRPERTLPELEAVIRERGAYGLTDLNWTRLTPWRELLAQFFDVPAWREYLDAVSGLRIGFSVDMDGREIHPSQALLLLGWMGARLGWGARERLAPSEAGGLLFRMARGDHAPVWVRLRPRFLRGVDEGNVTGVRLLADRDGAHAEFVIKRAEDGSAHADTEVRIEGAVRSRRRVFLPHPTATELLAEELSITRSDVVYEDALAALCAVT